MSEYKDPLPGEVDQLRAELRRLEKEIEGLRTALESQADTVRKWNEERAATHTTWVNEVELRKEAERRTEAAEKREAALKKRVGERLDMLLGKLAGPATTLSFLAAEDPEGDAVRWQDVERVFDEEIRALNRADEGGKPCHVCKGKGELHDTPNDTTVDCWCCKGSGVEPRRAERVR